MGVAIGPLTSLYFELQVDDVEVTWLLEPWERMARSRGELSRRATAASGLVVTTIKDESSCFLRS